MTPLPLNGLYVITDCVNCDGGEMMKKTELALMAGAAMIQYRNKHGNSETNFRLAGELLSLCRDYHVPMIINDDVPLACDIKADGIHLGANDMNPSMARSILGEDAIIGASCYNDINRVREMLDTDIDYIALGAFFPSPTKPDAKTATIDHLRDARNHFDIPIVAIGGITKENGKQLIDAGAHLLAVISAVYSAEDPYKETAELVNLFNKNV